MREQVLLSCMPYLPASVALAWTYEKAGTIWAPITLHALINAHVVRAFAAELLYKEGTMPKIVQLDSPRRGPDRRGRGRRAPCFRRQGAGRKTPLTRARTHITIEFQNGGMTFLRITDDGCGMAPEDAPHGVSAPRDEQNPQQRGPCLPSATLGFRGEALAAISAVSRRSTF